MKVLEDFDICDLDMETIRAYRNRHSAYRSEHVWESLPDEEYCSRNLRMRGKCVQREMEDYGGTDCCNGPEPGENSPHELQRI